MTEEAEPAAQSADASRASGADPALPARVGRILMTEEAIYGLILVSGMIVVSRTVAATSLNALVTVAVTVVVFFAAHVYAGTIARMAYTDGAAGIVPSARAAARHSEGMLLVSIVPLAILLLGAVHVISDDTAIWLALIADTVLLGILGWVAVSRWTKSLWMRLGSAFVTAAFGGIITLLKAFIHH